MAGIYIHIPFCKSKCAYCAFYSTADARLKNDFLSALEKELIIRKDYLGGDKVETIYFGGGTPSILSSEEIDKILKIIRLYFNVDNYSEITLEANPDTVDAFYLEKIRKAGVNRLSIGIQSFFDDDLNYLSRRHNSEHALRVIADAKNVGFENLSLDLIYGIPTLSDDKWRRNLDAFFASGAPHLSAYSLTVEQGTILERRINERLCADVDEEQSVRQYEILCDRAAAEGFEHYEISNYAQNGFRSRHNTAYWNGTKYLGLGPAAHSFDGNSRQWNVSNVKLYSTLVAAGGSFFETEVLSGDDKFNEYVMTSLRTSAGCDTNYVEKHFGFEKKENLLRESKRFIAENKMIYNDNHLILTRKGTLFADGIAAELFAR